jgi:hypothetical protein
MTAVFSTTRERMLEAYKKANQEVICHTIPYHSTGVIAFDVVDPSVAVPPGVAFAVARRNQAITLFDYGVGNEVNLGGSGNKRATDAETNLAKGHSTNGAQDYIIEGVGFSCRGMRLAYSGAQLTALQALVADADVEAMLLGDRTIYDPAGIVTPPQMQSPFNLEQGMFQALLAQTSVEFLFDRKRVEKIGALDLLPQAGANSFLRANGVPESSNKYRIPEGYVWRKDGQADSELEVNLRLQNAVVVPLNNLITWDVGATNVYPTTIWLELKMVLFGLGIDMPSQN